MINLKLNLLETKEEEDVLSSFTMKDEMNLDIFDKDKDYVLKPEIRKSLLEVTDKFMEFLGVQFFVHDVVFTGSLANYNWSDYSDLDLHIVIDFKESNHDLILLKEFFDSKKVVWNSSHDIEMKGFPVEIYVQDINERHESTGIYSVLKDKWIIHPQKHNIKIDQKKILEKASMWMKIIDKISEEPDQPGIIAKVERVRNKIKRFRQTGLEQGGEFSYENLAFKFLRRNEYIKKLLDLKNEILDKNLSLQESSNIYK